MSASAIPLYALEKKWQTVGSNNALIQAATQTPERKNIPLLDNDTNRNISTLGHRTMMSVGRWIVANFPQVRGSLKEQATFAVSTFIAQYYGDDLQFKDQAENWLYEHDKICDVRGWPFNMRSFLLNLIRAVRRDGDAGVLLVDIDGYPFLQMIPAHRIGSRFEEAIVEAGPYKGMRISQGVILNDYGRAVAYRVFLSNLNSWTEYVDIPATDMMLVFQPEYCDQVRGISEVGYLGLDCLDVAEFKRAELLSQVINAGFAFQEFNEDGEPAPGSDLGPLVIPGTDAVTAGTPTGLYTEVIDRGVARYFRAKSGGRLEQVKNDRPTANQQNFLKDTLRADLHGMGWSYDFSMDPSGVGGAPFRVIVEKINLNLHDIRESIVIPTRRRIDGWRISKGINRGELKEVSDWWKWEYQVPADITADRKYDSDVDIAEMRAAIKSPQQAIGNRGQYFEDVQDQCIDYYIRGVKQTQQKAKAAGVEAEWKDIAWNSPNGPTQDQPDPAQPVAAQE